MRKRTVVIAALLVFILVLTAVQIQLSRQQNRQTCDEPTIIKVGTMGTYEPFS